MSSLLDDLKGEAHEHTLAYGNIPSKRLPGFKPPVEELERFTSLGYSAVIHVTRCKGCGSTHRRLGGIMHESIGNKGSKRSIALHEGFIPNLPLDPKPVSYLGSTVGCCINCVENYGFQFDPAAEQRSIAS